MTQPRVYCLRISCVYARIDAQVLPPHAKETKTDVVVTYIHDITDVYTRHRLTYCWCIYKTYTGVYTRHRLVYIQDIYWCIYKTYTGVYT